MTKGRRNELQRQSHCVERFSTLQQFHPHRSSSLQRVSLTSYHRLLAPNRPPRLLRSLIGLSRWSSIFNGQDPRASP